MKNIRDVTVYGLLFPCNGKRQAIKETKIETTRLVNKRLIMIYQIVVYKAQRRIANFVIRAQKFSEEAELSSAHKDSGAL